MYLREKTNSNPNIDQMVNFFLIISQWQIFTLKNITSFYRYYVLYQVDSGAHYRDVLTLNEKHIKNSYIKKKKPSSY
jgi:hypothetical protein